MAATEYNGIMTYLDADGNETALYPITKKQNIAGMENIDAHVEAKNNPHAVTPGQIGASPLDHKHDGVYMKAPMMEVGVEYLTDELYLGKPVYRKIVTYSNSSTIGYNGGYRRYDIAHGISNFGRLVSCDTTTEWGAMLPYISTTGGFTSVSDCDSTNIVLKIYCDTWTATTFYFDMRYIKAE